MDEKETKLVESLKEGRDCAYEELFRVHYPVLKDLAMHIVHDEFAAKTIVSDFFFHLWEIRSELSIGTSLRGYLARGVYNRCLNYIRSPHFIRENKTLSDVENDFPSGDTPLDRMMARELEKDLAQAVSQLPEATRRVFLMHRSDGMKYEEIAQAAGISVNTVKYHIKRALALLRKRFGNDIPLLP